MVTAIFYVFIFLSIYVQVFLLLTFLENRRKLAPRAVRSAPEDYPSVTVIVPCYNEERTIGATAESLLALDYPKNKLKIFLVDDGSTDDTSAVMENFKNSPQVNIFKKENGGKYTALNLGLEHAQTDLVGCLDADSFVAPDALKKIIAYFNDQETMAVIPSIIAHRPRNIIELAQRAEYDWAVYIKKMLGFLGGIHVAPGPLSIYRRQVFKLIGPYRQAHNTEDMEIACRMQKHGLKIAQCHEAIVWTTVPDSIGRLYRQRLRWIYGFLNNAFDYRAMLFRRRYRHFAFFTIPSGLISITATIFVLVTLIRWIMVFAADKITEIRAVGWDSGFHWPNFDWFFVNTRANLFLLILLYGLVIFSIFMGRKILARASGRSIGSPLDIILLIIIYSVLAPLWLTQAVFQTLRGRKPAWH